MSFLTTSRTVFMQNPCHLLACFVALFVLPAAAQTSLTHSLSRTAPATGPLRSHPENPRWFTDSSRGPDSSLKAIYLTGSHHWNNLLDSAKLGQPLTNYVRKVIETVNDPDNVLYEISNETAIFSKDWQYHIIRLIKNYEATKPKQHPIGITVFDSGREGSMAALLHSPADWISPQNDGIAGDYQNDPPAADGRKVIISDTDHLWGVGGDRVWVWKSFTRGHHPIYMDPLRKEDWVRSSEADMEGARKAMGHTRTFAERMNLAAMKPRNKLASTTYCLADPGKEYLIYQPKAGESFCVELSAGTYRYEWFNPGQGESAGSGHVQAADGPQPFQAPFRGDAVLYLQRAKS